MQDREGIAGKLAGSLAAVALITIAAACSEGPTDPAVGEPVAENPAAGSAIVRTTTTGSNLDPDGYQLTIDGDRGPSIDINAVVTIRGLQSGDHQIGILGVAANCSILVSNPQDFYLYGFDGESVMVGFHLNCST